MLTLKRRAHVAQDVEFDFPVAELVQSFTDEQLREVGLFRNLRDADIARLRELKADELRRQAIANACCDDDDCDCPCHSTSARRAAPTDLGEQDFWPLIRALAVRRDLPALIRELEQRAWDRGDTNLDLTRAFGAKG